MRPRCGPLFIDGLRGVGDGESGVLCIDGLRHRRIDCLLVAGQSFRGLRCKRGAGPSVARVIFVYLSFFLGLLSLVMDQGPIYSLLWLIGFEPATFFWLLVRVAFVMQVLGLVIVFLQKRTKRHV